MKTINYTGNSKLITRIVHLLNRKAPLPLDGDGDAVWGTNGQVLTTDGNGNTSWTTPQGGGGDVTDVEVNGTSVVNAQGVAEVSVPTKTSDLTNDSGFITSADVPTKTSDLTNDSGFITSADVPTKTSDLTNDSGFITSLVNNLANYYTKSQTYTQAEVDALISGIVTLNILVVQALPTQDISTTTIYLVPKQDTGTSDIYDEYLYINNAWELIGTTQIDLSNYVTTTDLSTALADYVTSVGLATILAGYVQSSDLAAANTTYDHTASGLSATYVQEAIDEVADTVFESDALASGTDLNTVTKVGTYYSATDAITQSLVNCPVAQYSFMMHVFPWGSSAVAQLIIAYNKTYFRRSVGDSWSMVSDMTNVAYKNVNNQFSTHQSIHGSVSVDQQNGTTTTVGESYLVVGNNKARPFISSFFSP